jgi:hypothetical protein
MKTTRTRQISYAREVSLFNAVPRGRHCYHCIIMPYVCKQDPHSVAVSVRFQLLNQLTCFPLNLVGHYATRDHSNYVRINTLQLVMIIGRYTKLHVEATLSVLTVWPYSEA